MEKIKSAILEFLVCYLIGFLLMLWFYLPVMAMVEIFEKDIRITDLSLVDFLLYFVDFSMPLAITIPIFESLKK